MLKNKTYLSSQKQPSLASIKRRSLIQLAAVPALAYLPTSHAQTWPNRPLRLIVGYAPGGAVDAMGRLLAARLTEALGQQVVVENRTGASGMIAADTLAKSAPDGYTIMLAESSVLIAKLINPKITFDALTAFTPVAGAFYTPLMLVSNNDFPATDAKSLVRALKAKPGAYSYATPGVGTVQHLGFELLKSSTGTFAAHIPYRGASQIIPDVIGGQVQLGVLSVGAGLAQTKTGKLKAIALFSSSKFQGAEGISSLSDVMQNFNVAPNLFVVQPAGTPAELVNRLSATIKTIMESEEFSQTVIRQGVVSAYAPPTQLSNDWKQETAQWTRLIREQKIVAD
jgi:tripartite-type tricarboxylate transporter receptor subunit TctC